MAEFSKHREAILGSAKAHFGEQDTIEIPVPEWGESEEEPLVIYSSPVTLGNRRQVQRKNKEDPLGAMVDLVILKARDTDGNRIFKPIDRKALMTEADSDVVSRIAEEMVGEPLEDDETGERLDPAEQARKNSRTIPSS